MCLISEKKVAKSLFAASDSQNSDNADELLGLCSGQFTGSTSAATWGADADHQQSSQAIDDVHHGRSGLFMVTPESSNNELLDVLSGRFTSTQADPVDPDASRSEIIAGIFP